MSYAAQQWTTDALLPLLDCIPYRKMLAPRGFSGLHDPAYVRILLCATRRIWPGSTS